VPARGGGTRIDVPVLEAGAVPEHVLLLRDGEE
jgi:hypothetical protein